MLNNISIMGRLVRDPELRMTTTGKSVCYFTIANDRPFNGAERKETDFIDVVAWNSKADFIGKNFNKGKTIIVTGRLQMRVYKDKDERSVKAFEIVADSAEFVPMVSRLDGAIQESDNYPF